MATDATTTTNAAPIVDIAALRKSFGTNEVLKGIDLQVKRGEVIAAVGQTGKDIKQPKLHFQIRKAGQAIDPLKLLPPR